MINAIVTGGSGGIGKAIVKALSSRGVFTTYTYFNGKTTAQAIEDELLSKGFMAKPRFLDLNDQAACKDFITEYYKEYGSPDLLINNAGITDDSLLFSMGQTKWKNVIDTNLNGLFNITEPAVFYMMKAKKGRIINISSVSGINGIKGQCNYSASKAAIIGFTKALAKEIAPLGLSTNVVAPGGVETQMTKDLSESAISNMLSSIPAKRLCLPEEVANVVAYLCLDAPLYLNGSTIVLDGGMGSL